MIRHLLIVLITIVSCKSTNSDTSQTLDQGVNASGQPLFVWPSDRNHRNYDRLAHLMKEYATLTGNCLNKAPIGAGEVEFKSELESRRRIVRQAFVSGGVTKGCAVYKENFIDKTYKGSPFAQYGYCNESSYTALCLATQAGFKESEILKCDTMATADHTFTMVSRPGQKWCVMDRYDLIGKGNFFCNAYWYEGPKLLMVDNSSARDRWYQGIMCRPLDQWLRQLK